MLKYVEYLQFTTSETLLKEGRFHNKNFCGKSDNAGLNVSTCSYCYKLDKKIALAGKTVAQRHRLPLSRRRRSIVLGARQNRKSSATLLRSLKHENGVTRSCSRSGIVRDSRPEEAKMALTGKPTNGN